MDFGKIVGQLLQQSQGSGGNNRLQHALGDSGLGGIGGLDNMLGGLLGGQQGGGSGSSGLGDMLGGIGNMLGGSSGVGGMSNAQVGGIGALAGALLGGGGGAAKGALGGGAMAILGTLAMSALKNWQQGQAQAESQAVPVALSDTEIQQMQAPETAELCMKAMISAAKADGEIQADEMQQIVGKMQEDGITEEERDFVMTEMAAPLDVERLIAAVPSREVGAQVYAASLMAIRVDTNSEQAYLNHLANGLGLDRGTVQNLHRLVGV